MRTKAILYTIFSTAALTALVFMSACKSDKNVAPSAKTYTVSTLAALTFEDPETIGVTSDGKLLVADNVARKLYQESDALLFTRIIGNGTATSTDGNANEATFQRITAITSDTEGNIYFAENTVIRQINTDLITTTIAGNAGAAGSLASVNPLDARFTSIQGLAVNKAGELVISDAGAHKLFKYSLNNGVTTFSGRGEAGSSFGSAETTTFNRPTDLINLANGNMLVIDSNNHQLKEINSGGVTTIFAGSTKGYVDAVTSQAKFDTPTGIAQTPDGLIWVADAGNNRLRTITKGGNVLSTVGTGMAGTGDGTGDTATLSNLIGLSSTKDGTVYMVIGNPQVLRKVVETSK